MKLQFFFLFSLFLFVTNCSKKFDNPPPYFPPEIFRCKVDGVEWEAYDYRSGGLINISYGSSSPTDLQYYSDTKSLSLGAGRETEDQTVNQGMRLRAKPLEKGDNHLIYRRIAFHDGLIPPDCRNYELDTFSIRNITILEIDTIDYRMKGNFEFSAINDCSDTVHITEGYFDLSYSF